MSLRVWLPLNGDLRNQGISDLIFSAASSNTTTNANGKIGTCYTNNSHSVGGLISDKPILLGSQYSMCCWFKFTDLEASSSLGGGLVSQHRYSKNTGFGLTIKYVSSTTGYLSVNTGTGSARTYNTYCGTTLLQANTWYHACGTYDGTNIKIYVNGILEKTQAYTMSAPEDYLTIFCWSLSGSSGAAIHGNYKLNGALNDVRIYDHCLSAAEVKEIAQGLILHYKLDGGLFGNPNLVLGSNTTETSTNKWLGHSATGGNLSTLEYDGNIPCIRVTRNDVEQTSWDYLSYDRLLQSQIKTNTTYTVTFDCKPSVDGAIGFTGFVNGNATNYLTASTTNIQNICYANKWNHMVYQCVTKSSFDGITVGGQVVYFTRSASLRATNVSVLFKNIKVEEGTAATPWCPADSELTIDRTIVEDSSGFGNTGTAVGNLTSLNDTSRYSVSTYVGTTSKDYISTPNLLFENMKQGTVNIWIKRKSTDSTWRLYTFFANSYNWTGNSSDFIIIGSTGSQAIVLDCCSNTYSFTPDLNKWYMYTISWNLETHQAQMYVNGELKITKNSTNIDTTYASKHNGHYFGNSHSEVGDYLMSDARIYCTQLLDNDIKSLYNISMKVDNKNNIHVFELQENDNTQKIKKTGILSTARLNEKYNFDSKFHKQTRPNILPGLLHIKTTKNGHEVLINTLQSVPSTIMQSLAGKALTLSMDICAPGARYSTENNQTAWSQIRYGVHGSMTSQNSSGTTVTDYPFTGNFQYSGEAQRWYQSWTVPSNYNTYGNFTIAVQNFDKPASTNDALWFFKNIKLEVGSYPTPYVEYNKLNDTIIGGTTCSQIIER